jgi:hypothetical protein
LNPLLALKQFAKAPESVQEKCDLCAAPIGTAHEHLLEGERKLICACTACAILFPGQGEARFKRVSRRTERLPDFVLTEAVWEGLSVPIGVAFFVKRKDSVVAIYPGPAGATESQLTDESWSALVEANPPLAVLAQDVEALLVDRTSPKARAWRISIDVGYELTGLLRQHWRGFSGGSDARRELEKFFASLEGKTTPSGEKTSAPRSGET